MLLPGREAVTGLLDVPGLHPAALEYASSAYPNGLYQHQIASMRAFVRGVSVCLSTRTASGKSLVFFLAGIDVLARDPNATVLAIYPQRALGAEQEERWRAALHAAGVAAEVGRIDGGIDVGVRERVLRNHRVIISTPDVLHAWFLSSLDKPPVRRFLRRLRLVVVDEVHTYSGVFGSNAAYLFRRLHQACRRLGGDYRYVCASATIESPEHHVRRLFGVPFEHVGPDFDTSPRHPVTVELVQPSDADLLQGLVRLLNWLTTRTSHRVIVFVDSRRQTEMVSTILARRRSQRQEDLEPEDEGAQLAEDLAAFEPLQILPYRAGYEEEDRREIQRRLTAGGVRGVISTSALELGMDIPNLDVAVLVGVPASGTSFWQRLGRVGRHGPGRVIVIHTGSVLDVQVFRHPESLLERPLQDSTLYLENRRVQYIHALCLARSGGEWDMVSGVPSEDAPIVLDREIEWPDGFAELCQQERTGQVPLELQSIKMEAGDDPNHSFPLRDVEVQFRVQLRGPNLERRGQLSYGQVLREAYPGAVYYYMARPYRVVQVHTHRREIIVRPEHQYFTRPLMPPATVYPALHHEATKRAEQRGDAVLVETDLQIREQVVGFEERRGGRRLRMAYPIASRDVRGLSYTRRTFARTFFTTGVLLRHPVFEEPLVVADAVAEAIYEALLLVVPFDRRDLGFATGTLRLDGLTLRRGQRFLCLYDQTYGSLRLSGRLLDPDVFPEVFRRLPDAGRVVVRNLAPEPDLEADEDQSIVSDPWIELKRQATWEAILTLSGLADTPSASILTPFAGGAEVAAASDRLRRVIRPGSSGLALHHDNDEFVVERVFFHPEGLRYRGHYADTSAGDTCAVIWPVEAIVDIPGVTEWAWFDLETGEVVDIQEPRSGFVNTNM